MRKQDSEQQGFKLEGIDFVDQPLLAVEPLQAKHIAPSFKPVRPCTKNNFRLQPFHWHKWPAQMPVLKEEGRQAKPRYFQDEQLKEWCTRAQIIKVYAYEGKDCTQSPQQYPIRLQALNLVNLKGVFHSSEQSGKKDRLQFDSRFEGGNLAAAYRHSGNEYSLVLKRDSNSTGYTYWFYFSVRGMRKGETYQFNIINFRKAKSLFEKGMRVAACSQKTGWTFNPHKVQYYANGLLDQRERKLYSCSFKYTCDDQANVCFARQLPYTYSRLIHFLNNAQVPYFSLCKSLFGVDVPAVELGARDKPVILVIARQHPSQAFSSYLAEALITGLLEKSGLQLALLQRFRVVVVPMVNVDGVILGNSRCSASGLDPNRQWRSDNRYQPVISHIRDLVSKALQPSRIEVFLDLHGHSKQIGFLSYSCLKQQELDLSELLAHYNPDFDIGKCSFGIDSAKRHTARAFLHSFARVSMTIQTSSFGKYIHPNNPELCCHWQKQAFFEFGKTILKSLAVNLKVNTLQSPLPCHQLQNDLAESDSEAEEDINFQLLDQLSVYTPVKKTIKTKGEEKYRVRKVHSTIRNNSIQKQLNFTKNDAQRNKIKTKEPSLQKKQVPALKVVKSKQEQGFVAYLQGNQKPSRRMAVPAPQFSSRKIEQVLRPIYQPRRQRQISSVNHTRVQQKRRESRLVASRMQKLNRLEQTLKPSMEELRRVMQSRQVSELYKLLNQSRRVQPELIVRQVTRLDDLQRNKTNYLKTNPYDLFCDKVLRIG